MESIGALKISSLVGTGSNINNNSLIQNQNNYIQIGGSVLNQEIIKQMSPQQLYTIEWILKTIEITETD